MKGLKKKFSSFFALVLAIVVLAPAFTIYAIETPEFIVSGSTAFAGERFEVDIYLSDDSSVYGGNFTLQYDSDYMEVKEYSIGDCLDNHIKNCNLNYQSAGNLIRFTFSGASAVGSDECILTLTFVAKEKTGVSALTFTDYRMYGSDGKAFACNALDGEVLIKSEPEELEVGIPKNATLVTEYDYAVYRFTPDESGEYVFSSQGDLNVSGYLLNEDNEIVASSENEEGNFEFAVELTKETTYQLEAWLYGEILVGDFFVMVEKAGMITSIDIGEDLKGWVGISNFTIAPQILPEDATEEITWSSSDESVATVSGTGEVALVSDGSATITATTASGIRDSILVTSLAVDEVFQDATQSVEFDEEMRSTYYKFTPLATGNYKFIVENSVSAGFQIDGVSDYYYGTSMDFSCQLTEGTTYYIAVERDAISDDGTYSFLIEKVHGIQSLEIVSLPTRMTYYEGCGSFEYSGLKVKAILEDGTDAYWSYSLGPGEDNTLTDVSITTVYKGSEYVRSDISCNGITVSFSFNVSENPVESIELFSGEISTYVENTNGYQNNGHWIYYVGAPYEYKFKINYKDGTSRIVNVSDEIDGYRVEWYNNQYSEPWTVGENYITVSYCNREAKVPVQVVPNNIDSVVLNSAPTHVYIYGDVEYGYVYEGMYHFEPSNLEGFSLKVVYKDGSERIYTEADIDGERNIEGQPLYFEWLSNVEVGTYSTQIEYMGYTMEYEVEVQACPIASIEVAKAPTLSNYHTSYLADFAGMQVEINYLDGTNKIVNIQESEIQYKFYPGQIPRLVRTIVVDGQLMNIEEEVDWMYQGYVSYYSIDYMGYTYLYRDITFEDNNKVDTVEVVELATGDEKIVLEISYLDGTTETIEYNLVWYDYGSDYYRVFVDTKYGIAQVGISVEDNEAGIITSYIVNVLGDEIEIPVEAMDLIIDKKPDKTCYELGESLDLTGLRLRMAYANGQYQDVERGFLVSCFDSSTPGKKVIEITYGEFSTNFEVNVEEYEGNQKEDGYIGTAMPDFIDENATETDYYIESVEQFNNFQAISKTNNFAGITVHLAANVSLDENFVGIGSTEIPFAGTFDGHGYAITKMSSANGLFVAVEGATIQKLVIGSAKVTVSDGSSYAGILVGVANGATIDNVIISKSKVITEATDTTAIGGMFGKVTGEVTISNSNVRRLVIKSAGETTTTDSFVGYAETAATMSNCAVVNSYIGGTFVNCSVLDEQ